MGLTMVALGQQRFAVGFDRVAVLQSGPDQEGCIDFYGSELAPLPGR